MRILRDMGLTFFLVLFLISSSFADDAKKAGTDKKDRPAAGLKVRNICSCIRNP